MLGEVQIFNHLSHEILIAFAVLFGILVGCSALLRVRGVSGELAARVRTWWLIIGALAVVIGISKWATILFLAAVCFLALREFFQLVPIRDSDRPVLIWIWLSIPIQFLWVWTGWVGMFIVFIPVYMFVLVPTQVVLAGKTEGFLKAVGTIQWGLMMTLFSLSHAAMLLTLPLGEQPHVAPAWPTDSSEQCAGIGLLVLLLLLTQLNDVAQYCWGKSLGKQKVLPTVSPGKTTVGLIGGVATTTVVAAVVGPWLSLLDFPCAILIGLVVGLAGFAGDVCVSAIKRDLGVKDTGAALPGHGGFLDRLDSLTFTAPLFFHIVYFFYG